MRAILSFLSLPAALAGAMAMWGVLAFGEAEAAPMAEPTDHAAWTQILETYVRVGEDGLNRFDYGGLKNDAAASKALDAYIDDLAVMDIAGLSSRDAQFAAWANLYNALTVKVVTEKYPVKSIRDIRSGPFSPGPWKRKLITVNGAKMSLDDIEHGVLRKQWDDPRVHYAVNCASFGCPNLQPRAWRAETLDADLDAAARAFVNHPRGVMPATDGRLRLSSIYNWFQEDFGGDEAGVLAHLETYAEPALKARIETARGVSAYDYDWTLNDVQEAR